MANIRAEREARRVASPLPGDDPFADFREIMLLEVEHAFRYRHSLGKVSRFFLGLEQGKLLATRCKDCGKVWLPPRAICPEDLSVTEWVELPGGGVLESWTICPVVPRYLETDAPYVLAYVRFDGASTSFLHQLRGANIDTLRYGLPVKAVFSPRAERHPLEQIWFEPT